MIIIRHCSIIVGMTIGIVGMTIGIVVSIVIVGASSIVILKPLLKSKIVLNCKLFVANDHYLALEELKRASGKKHHGCMLLLLLFLVAEPT